MDMAIKDMATRTAGMTPQDARDYRQGYEQGMRDDAAKQALEAAGTEKQAEAKRHDAFTRAIIDLINAVLAMLGIRTRVTGGTWKPPAPAQVAQQAVADEQAKHAVDEPREVLRVARRIQLGATVDQARLSEDVLGALITMDKPALANVIQSDMGAIGRWVASQQGVAASSLDDRDRAASREYERLYAGSRTPAEDPDYAPAATRRL